MVQRGGIYGLLRRMGLYGLLVAGSLVFSIPFAWLLLSSFKTNEEQFLDPPRWLPRTPSAARQSPYVARDEYPEIERPRACPPSRWPELHPKLVAATKKAINAVGLPAASVPAGELQAEVAEGVFRSVADSITDDLWFVSEETLLAAWTKRVTPHAVSTCRDAAYKRFLIGPVRVKSIEQKEETLGGGDAIAPLWTALGGQVRNEEGEGRPCALLSYQFAGDEKKAVLQGVFRIGFPVEQMKKLVLSLRPDHSWHRLDCGLEADGRLWESREPFYATNNRWQEQVWQFPSDDDRSMKIKSWIVLEPKGESDFATAGHVRLTFTLAAQSRTESWLAKLWNNYRWAFKQMPFWRYTAVSFFLCAMNILGQLVGSSLAAYAFARLTWPGRNACFLVLLGTLMLPPAVTMVPSFLIFKSIGWYNTLLVLWVPSFCGAAFNIFLLRQFMRGIPKDLEDAAKIDGCSFFGVYRHVILPSIRPALAAIAIFTFMGTWNNFMGPLVFLNDQSKYPLALGIFGLQTQAGGNFGLIMAASALMTLPVVFMFFLCQRYFIQGITLTGMKG
ncbi:ABC transporter permease subunit [bacterium]|nr:ABC transporter permease subunit [bacterium]